MTKGQCENCGGFPPVITDGPFAGMRDELDYCELCSKDLCDKCMAKPTCDSGILAGDTHAHKPSEDEGAAVSEAV